MSYRNSTAMLLTACVAFLVGCGEPDFYRCSGVVTLNDKPIPQLQITFQPETVGSRPPIGVTDDRGHFDMTSGREYGVQPGNYTIIIEDPTAAFGRKTSTEADYLYVVGRYGPKETDLKYEATSNQHNYELKFTK